MGAIGGRRRCVYRRIPLPLRALERALLEPTRVREFVPARGFSRTARSGSRKMGCRRRGQSRVQEDWRTSGRLAAGRSDRRQPTEDPHFPENRAVIWLSWVLASMVSAAAVALVARRAQGGAELAVLALMCWLVLFSLGYALPRAAGAGELAARA